MEGKVAEKINCKEKFFYPSKPKELLLNFELHYGLFAEEKIPAMRMIGEFEPLAIFQNTTCSESAEVLFDKLSPLMENSSLLLDSDILPKLDNLLPRKDFTQSEVAAIKSLWAEKIKFNKFTANTTTVYLYYTPSFLNHSCRPNALFLPRKGILIEITISYSSEQASLFVCSCSKCLVSTSGSKAEEKKTFCHYCGTNSEKLCRCSKCGIAWYCSKQCQIEHWKILHKFVCAEWNNI